MATTITGISKSKVISNLDTYNHTIGTNNMYTIKMDVSELPPSGVSIVIQQNGSTKLTTVAPASTQQLVSAQITLSCAVNDVISVIVSSSQARESAPNVIKGILNIHVGSV